jgi:hypothetical protein
MVALRRKVVATVDDSIDEASADVTAVLKDGRRVHVFVEHAIGSLQRQQRRQGRRCGPRFPARPGLHHGLDRLAGRHSVAPGQLALAAPVLQGVTGPARDEFLFDHMRSPATATLAWPIADPASLAVTVRAKWDAPREKPAGLAIRATGAQTVEITRPASGFDAGALYEVTYVARDPVVLGLGFAATRDVAPSCGATPARPIRWRPTGAAACSARSASACRSPAASCATSSGSASTRTWRAARCSTA